MVSLSNVTGAGGEGGGGGGRRSLPNHDSGRRIANVVTTAKAVCMTEVAEMNTLAMLHASLMSAKSARLVVCNEICYVFNKDAAMSIPEMVREEEKERRKAERFNRSRNTQ